MASPRDLLNIERVGQAMESQARIRGPVGDVQLVKLETSVAGVELSRRGSSRITFMGRLGKVSSLRLPPELNPRRGGEIVIKSIARPDGHLVPVWAETPHDGQSSLLPGFRRHVTPKRNKLAYAGIVAAGALAPSLLLSGWEAALALPATGAVGSAAILALGWLEFSRQRKINFLLRILD